LNSSLLVVEQLAAERGEIRLVRRSLNVVAAANALNPGGVADLPGPRRNLFGQSEAEALTKLPPKTLNNAVVAAAEICPDDLLITLYETAREKFYLAMASRNRR